MTPSQVWLSEQIFWLRLHMETWATKGWYTTEENVSHNNFPLLTNLGEEVAGVPAHRHDGKVASPNLYRSLFSLW